MKMGTVDTVGIMGQGRDVFSCLQEWPVGACLSKMKVS